MASTDSPDVDRGEASASDYELGSELWAVAERLGKVAAPIALVGALGYYIGFVRQDALLHHFGLNTTIVELSPQEYAIRSTDALVRFVVGTSLIGILLVGSYSALVASSTWCNGSRARVVTAFAMVGGAVALSFGAWRLARPVPLQGFYLFGPISLCFGALLLLYGAGVMRRPDGRWRLPRWLPAFARWIGATSIGLLVTTSLFWAANDFARAQGASRAAELEGNLSQLPTVVLYSTTKLATTSSSVTEEHLDPGNGPISYRYRYTGLKLFMRNQGRYILIPASWSSTVYPTEPILILNENDLVRLELSL